MEVFHEVNTLQSYLAQFQNIRSIGFVPTMGALHEGHLSLVEIAQEENDVVVASIFVNPTQFDKEEDLIKYPKSIEKDLKMLEPYCDVVFVPSVKEMYPELVASKKFDFKGLDQVMEGAFRIGHFDGVGTIVKRLFEIVQPQKAYFGEKDFQQLAIIKKMVEIENLPVEIIGCPIRREKDGLAMSSRNQRLTKIQRKEAPLIYQTLLKSQSMFEKSDVQAVKKMVHQTFENNGILRLEYFEIADSENLKPITTKEMGHTYRGFIAVFADNVRLIDNIALN